MYSDLECIWQSEKTTIRQRFLFLFENSLFTDVTFLVGASKKPIQAHKMVLAAASPVFYAMFFGSLQEKQNEIEIPDIPPDIFQALMRCLYADDYSPEPHLALYVWYTAKKYLIPGLADACIDILQDTVCSDNVIQLYETVLHLMPNEQGLLDLCWDVLTENLEVVLEDENFLQVHYETLFRILAESETTVPEIALYKAAISWAKAKCSSKNIIVTPKNLRDTLGEALFKIRFPTMSRKEFVNEPARSGILTDDEIVDVAMYFLIKEHPLTPFPSTHRIHSIWEWPLDNFPYISNSACLIIRLHVSSQMYLTRIGVRENVEFKYHKGVRMETVDTDTEVVHKSILIEDQESCSVMFFKLNQPLKLSAESVHLLTIPSHKNARAITFSEAPQVINVSAASDNKKLFLEYNVPSQSNSNIIFSKSEDPVFYLYFYVGCFDLDRNQM